ncbi:hypothetical protein [Halorussus amylolyticus]|uniref:hypothetical protein n=1 Tax=Halorussus amylolyticus TaxID=1126242 RepID=UPI001052A4F5|nr:hypothetical protein [Halorussus amylolyticus]
MTADDLSEGEVIRRFKQISEKNSEYSERKEEYKREVLAQEEEEIRDRLEKGIQRDKKHDNLLRQTISAFLPGGPIERETEWTFLGAEPLCEQNLPNADALFGNPERNMALLVECKTSLSRPTQALKQVYDATENIRDNLDYLSEKVGMEIDELECAICIPSVVDRRIISQIEEHEEQNQDREKVFVWRIHHFDGETLDLYTDIETREDGEMTHNSELAPILNAGVELTYGRQVMPAFFPSSHPEVIMEELFSSIIENRLMDDKPFRHFKGEEIQSELTSQKNLPHYDADVIGERIYSELIRRFKEFNLISELSSSETDLEVDENECVFKYQVRGKSPDTVIANLRKRYLNRAVEDQAEIKAKRQVIDEFDEEQSALADFW